MTSIEQGKEVYKRVRLFARGTSETNHDQAVVQVDDSVVLDKGDFRKVNEAKRVHASRS